MMRQCAIAVLALLLHQLGAAQTWQTVKPAELMAMLDASAAKYKAYNAYHLTSNLYAYHNSTDPRPAEEAISQVWKDGNKAKAEHMGMVSYQNEDLRVSIDPEERLMMIAEPQDFFGLLGQEYRESVFQAAAITRADLPDGARFRAKFGPGSDYELIEFKFDKAGWLRRMETHWGQPIALAPDNPMTALITPMVVLEMGVPQRIAPGSVVVDPSVAVRIVKGKPVVAQAYTGYELIDNRVHQ